MRDAVDNEDEDAKDAGNKGGGRVGGGGELGALLESLLKLHRLHRGMWRAHYKPHGRAVQVDPRLTLLAFNA